MPLMKSKSKKAFEHNIKAEMDAGKPQDQALAIAYDVKRRNKKMAKGGLIERDIKPTVDSRDPMEMGMKHELEMHHEDKAARGRKLAGEDNDMEMEKHPMMEMHDEYKQKMSHADDRDMEFQKHPMMENHGLDKQRRSNVDEDEMEFSMDPSIEKHHEAMAAEADHDDEFGEDMVGRIMRKKYAKGGMVDLAEEEAEHSNQYYPINEHDVVDKKWDDHTERHADEDMHGRSEDYSTPEDDDMHGDDIQEDVMDHIDRIMSKMNRKKR